MGADEEVPVEKSGGVWPYVLGALLAACAVGIAGVALRELLDDAPSWRRVWGCTSASLGFFGASAAIVVTVRLHRHRQKAITELRASHPTAPWLWRPEWAEGKIVCDTRKTTVSAWGFALFWNVLTSHLVFIVHDEIVVKENFAALLALVFPLVGAGLLIRALRVSLRSRKFGTSTLELAYVPGAIGGKLAGVLRIETKVLPRDGFRLTLSSIRRVVGQGENSSKTEHVLWQDEQHLDRELLERDPQRTALPVSFRIPPDGEPSDDTEPLQTLLWRLEVHAATSGLDYHAGFEVPVFQNGAPRAVPEPLHESDARSGRKFSTRRGSPCLARARFGGAAPPRTSRQGVLFPPCPKSTCGRASDTIHAPLARNHSAPDRFQGPLHLPARDRPDRRSPRLRIARSLV